MGIWKKVAHSNLAIRLTHWEYWPFGIIQLPLFVYWLWLSLRCRSFFFFSASNPGIDTGGMFGESKFAVLSKVPTRYKPQAILVRARTPLADVLQEMRRANLEFPVICKPDYGERGWRVQRIRSTEELDTYLQESHVPFIVQDLVSLPFEFGVFYVRYPREEHGHVTSIVAKEMLAAVGNGEASLRDLMLADDRAKLQWRRLQHRFADVLDRVLAPGERLELESIGNHSLGTKFLDMSHLINATMSSSFDHIARQIDGFFFGRFDLRCASLEDLVAGRVMILELNGCGAEPAHIYAPGFSLYRAMGVMFRHWHNIYIVSRQNHALGVPYLSFREGIRFYRFFRQQVRS